MVASENERLDARIEGTQLVVTRRYVANWLWRGLSAPRHRTTPPGGEQLRLGAGGSPTYACFILASEPGRATQAIW